MNRAHRGSSRRAALLTVPLAALGLTVVSPAHAGDRPEVDVTRWSTETATVDWVERDDADRLGRPGNVHAGGILVERSHGVTDVFGVLIDYQCDGSELPDQGGANGCTPLVTSEIVHDGATLTVRRAAGTARLVGAVRLVDISQEHPEELVEVDLTWTSGGRPTRERDAGVDDTPTGWVRHDVTTTTWPGVGTTGTVGGSLLGDHAADVTGSALFAVDGRLVAWSRGESTTPDDDGGLG